MTGRRVVVVGDVILDQDITGRAERLCPDAPVPVVDVDDVIARPGGAGLTAALCAREGARTTLVAPFADDPEGARLRSILEASGVEVVALEQHGRTRVKSRLRTDGQSIVRIDTGGPAAPAGPPPEAVRGALGSASAVLVSCYGAGTSTDSGMRELLEESADLRPLLWDPHPRGGSPVPGCALVTPNLMEARAASEATSATPAELATTLRRQWRASAVAVTDGRSGAWLASGDERTRLVPAQAVSGDTCGAGDSFAAAAAVALARGATSSRATAWAVQRAAEFVAAGGAAGLTPLIDDGGDPSMRPPGLPGTDWVAPVTVRQAGALLKRVRDSGGVTVATGGCFDLLHAGHIETLSAARALGDVLVVLLNSDSSVRRLKGLHRPIHSAQDRARVLLALSCVDAVVVFDDDDPRAALETLQPQVWAKGGDYAVADLPEAAVVSAWGGRCVVLPYLPDRSTTSAVDRLAAAREAAG